MVYEDEAYDWISPTDTSSGTYTVEDGELVLDNSMRYRNLYAETITVTAPDWYDGLVLSVPTQPDTYDGLNERDEFFTALDGYYPALDLPWDVESALNCLVLW